MWHPNNPLITTTGILAGMVVTAVTWWWVRRLWALTGLTLHLPNR